MSGRTEVRRVPKPWGHETIWARHELYVGKILHIKAGQALSVQYHNVKDETVYLLSGELIYRVQMGGSDDEPSDVRPQDRRGVPDHAGHDSPDGSRHRLRHSRGLDAASGRRRPPQGPLRTRGNERTMKVIIPLAGKGTRLRPHTHITPKPMLKIAGKPVIDYVMEDLQRARQRRAGHLHHRASQGQGRGVRAHEVSRSTPCSSSRRCRTARPARWRWRSRTSTSRCSSSSSTRSSTPDLSVVKRTDADGIIWVKTVEDYQRFGVVVTDTRRQHDEDRREADRRRSRSARTSGCTTSRTGSCCTRGSTTRSSSRRTRASTTSPTRSST